MTGTPPAVDGLYVDREGSIWLQRRGHMCVQTSFGGGYYVPDAEDAEELADFGPFERLVPLTAEELAVVHDIATQLRSAVIGTAALCEKHGIPQPEITELLIKADQWRAIAEKTGAP